MKVYVIVGESKMFENISARAVYTKKVDADSHVEDEKRMWFDDRTVVVELELDRELLRA